MYNHAKPDINELPSTRRLLQSTVIALVAAAIILVAVVLPAEYAVDPTGIGRVLGLTEMGEVKAQLAKEAAADAESNTGEAAAVDPGPARAPDPAVATGRAGAGPAQGTIAADAVAGAPASSQTWRNEMQVVLQPGQGAEIKLAMKAGEQAEFSWTVQDGAVNFDTHADGGGQSISYEKGRNVRADEGVLEAAFDGNHGWFWRNRGDAPVTVVLRVRGQYSSIKRLV